MTRRKRVIVRRLRKKSRLKRPIPVVFIKEHFAVARYWNPKAV
jgi:hypothetical protein